MLNRRQEGARWESLALRHLKKAGLKLVQKNYQCRSGEIDLILREHPSRLVFVEVRYRQSTAYGTAAATVTNEKQQRIKLTAAHFLQNHPEFGAYDCRFDVVAIQGSEPRKLEIEWIKNAFY